jgi:alkanesulfonate monooxygenase SsuD/methylene tetrahydromethanopterin reductase-like flavin-dependent oxidoreductase (luciferase family)
VVQIGVVAPADRREVRRLEDLGVESFWVGGHLASVNPTPEPVVRLARLAEQVEQASIGTATLVLPWYPPPVVAKQLADIDRACGGRLVVGVGAGGEYPDDFAAAGIPITERGSRLDESIGLLRRFWTGEPVDHRGPHFRYRSLRVHPRPVQVAGPPIIVTGRRGAAMRRAATLGDGWMPYLYSPERYASSVSAIEEVAAAAGRELTRFRWMVYVLVSVDDDRQAARASAGRFVHSTWSGDDAAIDRLAVTGTPADVTTKLSAFVRAGVTQFVVLPCSPSEPAGLERLLSEVFPNLERP